MIVCMSVLMSDTLSFVIMVGAATQEPQPPPSRGWLWGEGGERFVKQNSRSVAITQDVPNTRATTVSCACSAMVQAMQNIALLDH